MKKVLVLEDESSIRSFIVINLRRAGYDVIEAESGEEALERLKENPDTKVALLDIMLPGIDGFEVCRRIRATNTKIGIIMLTARSQEMDKVTGLMTGADDYVTKPFSPAELTARVDALFRRAGGEEAVQSGEDLPGALPAQHPEPDAGEERAAHQADPGGILHHEGVHGESRPGAVPGGDLGHGVGPGLLRGAEDRGCEHPAAAAEDRGQCAKSHVHHHSMGVWIQMGLLKRKDPWTERYRQVWKQEQAFWKKYEERPAASLEQKLLDAAPEKLLELLHGAFVKAFAAVFDKGEGVISRAGGLPECRRTYQVNDLAAQLWEDRKSLRAFSKEAARRGRGSLLAAGGAGVGLGLLGMVLPDVPLFTAALLKAVYETAESFGFRHEERGEQIVCPAGDPGVAELGRGSGPPEPGAGHLCPDGTVAGAGGPAPAGVRRRAAAVRGGAGRKAAAKHPRGRGGGRNR